MEQLQFSYLFSKINDFDKELVLSKSCTLCILHVDEKPPHLGISLKNSYFSWKAKGLDLDIPLSRVLNSIEKNCIPAVFIHLDFELEIEQVKKVFNNPNFSKNCYQPIKSLLEIPAEREFIFDMLNYLSSCGKITHTFPVNLPKQFIGIQTYDSNDVLNRINNLRNV